MESMKPYEIAENIFFGSYKTIGYDVSYRITEMESEAWVFFQGTSSSKDILLDMDFLPRNFYDLNVFGGYARGILSANELIQMIPYGRPIHICGHSMGASYALLFSYMLWKDMGVKADKIVLFGCPKIFADRKSLKLYQNVGFNVSNYVNVMDVVPMIPFFYHNVDKIKLGKFNLRQFFKMEENHMNYTDKCLYGA